MNDDTRPWQTTSVTMGGTILPPLMRAQSLRPLREHRKKEKLAVFLFFNYPSRYAPRETEGQPQNGNNEFVSPEKKQKTILENWKFNFPVFISILGLMVFESWVDAKTSKVK